MFPEERASMSNRRASDANYDPVQMDMSEVLRVYTCRHFFYLVLKYRKIWTDRVNTVIDRNFLYAFRDFFTLDVRFFQCSRGHVYNMYTDLKNKRLFTQVEKSCFSKLK